MEITNSQLEMHFSNLLKKTRINSRDCEQPLDRIMEFSNPRQIRAQVTLMEIKISLKLEMLGKLIRIQFSRIQLGFRQTAIFLLFKTNNKERIDLDYKQIRRHKIILVKLINSLLDLVSLTLNHKVVLISNLRFSKI